MVVGEIVSRMGVNMEGVGKCIWVSGKVLHFLANFDFKLAWAGFRVEIRQLSLLQDIFCFFFNFLKFHPLIEILESRAQPGN